MRANLAWHTTQDTGYGRFGLELSQALMDLGVENCGDPTPPEPNREVGDNPLRSVAPVSLFLSTPPHLRGTWSDQLHSMFTMWESSSIPAGFRENLESFERVFVPSPQNQELFSQYHKDVRYIPLAVGKQWIPRQRHRDKRQDFIFLTAGTGPRKNTLAVAMAFYQLFGKGRLRKGQPVLWIRGRDGQNGAHTRVFTQPLTNDSELWLYDQAHCFVSASKGEGFGLMPAQAIAQGCPTILPDAHGHAVFAQYGIPYSVQEVPCGHHTFWGDGGTWWEPNFEELCQRMWDVYNNYDAYSDRALLDAQAFRSEFSWEKTAEKVIYHLPELFDPDPINPQWVKTQAQTYLVRVTRPACYTINGIRYYYAPGQDYWETAEMKVVLAKDGYLTADCIDPMEMGRKLGAELLSDARKAVCPTCSRPMNPEV